MNLSSKDQFRFVSARKPVGVIARYGGNYSFGPLQTTPVFASYWYFAAERQNIFFKRIRRDGPPWSDDTILQEYKFTNAYRASDRVSQYLIREVIYQGDQTATEVFFRTLLFKFFNKIDTWKLLVAKFGIPSAKKFSTKAYDEVLTTALESGKRIYSAAYIMPTGVGKDRPKRKHSMHLALLKRMLDDELPDRLTDCKTMGRAFELIRHYPTIGDFLGYQFITDLNYSSFLNFKETEFTIAGPGAKDGLKKCFGSFGGFTEVEVIKLVMERQDTEFSRLGLEFKSLWGRPLQLIDCQNLFCEISKYARVKHPEVLGLSGRTRIKQKFSASDDTIAPWYPPKWEINDLIKKDTKNASI
jgi:hypothetical protein